jgi:hypothetical protein
MAYTQTDLDNVEAAIRARIAGTALKSFSAGATSGAYDTMTLTELRTLRNDIAAEVGAVSGAFAPRTYAKDGGRC